MGKRQSQSREFWEEETRFIEKVDYNTNAFNHDIDCFKRYIIMQMQSCTKDGFNDLADRMKSILNSLNN